jgi:flagellum-specific peptidoglycan hydrolase FlgJ
MSAQDFVKMYYSQAAAVSTKELPPAFILAHAYLESGRGQSELTKKANNFFGVKAIKNQPFITMRTRELQNGQYIVIPQNFRKYATPQQSFEAYSNLLKIPRYKNVRTAKTYLDKAKQLKLTGYYGAENSAIINLANLATTIDGIIKKNKLSNPNTILIGPIIGLLLLTTFLASSNK